VVDTGDRVPDREAREGSELALPDPFLMMGAYTPSIQDGTEEEEHVLLDELDPRPRKRIRPVQDDADMPRLKLAPIVKQEPWERYAQPASASNTPASLVDSSSLAMQRAKVDREQVIAAAAKAQEAAKEEAARVAAEAARKEEERAARRERALAKKAMTAEEKEALKEKRLQKLVGAVVVKCMSKYQKQMDHELFKKHAKEVS
jgi:[histone H3]-lysine36 N-trimethyltransferase